MIQELKILLFSFMGFIISRREGIFWQNIKRLNGFGKLIGDDNAGKKGKSWRLRQPEKLWPLLKRKMMLRCLIKDH
jgi:hypothetical protein